MKPRTNLLAACIFAAAVVVAVVFSVPQSISVPNAELERYPTISKDLWLPELKGEEVATLLAPPMVPPPIDRDHATNVMVTLEISEKELTIDEATGTKYKSWMFGDQVPGPMIRVREGDMVHVTLINPKGNGFPHNVDFHAATGPGGGAQVSNVLPGNSKSFFFRALTPGLWIYHCATAPLNMHIGNGMFGLILVEPRDGLPEVDKEYYVLQNEFYLDQERGYAGVAQFNDDKAVDAHPDYVVFNGSTGALLGDNSLTAEVGDTVRLHVGNIGLNYNSSFHIIGEIFDYVYVHGGTPPIYGVQATMVPAGGSSMIEFMVDYPGNYTLVDHSLARRAFGNLAVTGEANPEIFSGEVGERFGSPYTN